MLHHQYACPDCGRTLQAAEDVTGRSVRCLGCQTVFVAAGVPAASWSQPPAVIARAAPLPLPPAPPVEPEIQLEVIEAGAPFGLPSVFSSEPPPPPSPSPSRVPPPLPARPDPPAASTDSADDIVIPPEPRSRRFPVGPVVIGGAAVVTVAVGIVIALAVRYAGKPADTQAKATVPAPVAGQLPGEVSPPPATDPRDDEIADLDPRRSRREEEEDIPVRTGSSTTARPDRPVGDSVLPDVGSIIPKVPASATGPKPADPAPRSAPPPPGRPTELDAGPATAADGQIPPALLARLKAATVFVKVHLTAGGATGSGFVLQVDGHTALIVSNDHVVNPTSKQGASLGPARHEVVFNSGRKTEFALPAEVVAADHDRDLAILKVRGTRGKDAFPEPINTTDRLSLTETMPVYIIGFPFGEMLSTTHGNPTVTIGKGSISSLRDDDAGDAAVIQIDGDVNPGNSGGPVVDSRGRLVGVTVAKLRFTNIGMAIPRVELTRMLNGRLGNLAFRVGRTFGGTVEIEVTGSLIDPLDRVKKGSIRVTRADALKEKPSVGADGKWAPLPGATTTEMRGEGRHLNAVVKLPLKDRDRGRIDILFQPSCVDRDGKTNYFAPVKKTLVQTDGPVDGVPGGPPGFPGTFPMPPGGPGAVPGVPGGPPPGPVPPGGGSPRPGGPGAAPGGPPPLPIPPPPPGGAGGFQGRPGAGGLPMPPGGQGRPPAGPGGGSYPPGTPPMPPGG